ncbi:MAG: carboxypeptidase-like regulatory domain-containing protein, partial [Acidobacteriaceae bacterium]
MGSNSFFKPFLTLLAAVAVLLSAGYVSAQTVTGSIGGSITDQSGAAVSGATITATNLATGVATTTRSDSSGVYNIQFLPIGAYSVSATGTGFQTSTVSSLTLEIDQIARLNFKLQVGSVSTTISVSSESGAALQTQNPTLGTTVSSNTIENLPLSGLNFQTAGMFVPGAVNPTYSSMGGTNGYERDTSGGAVPSFNGNRQQGNNYIMDGVEINETLNNLVGYNPAPEAIGEMRTVTANADAEYGDVNGGEILMVTKSGTNN